MDASQLLGKRFVLGILVAGELAVVGGLAAVAWHAWQQNQAPGPGGTTVSQPAAVPPQAGRSQPRPSTTMPVPVRPTAAPTPGFRTDPLFFNQVTLDINREEIAFEQLEWRIVHGAMDGMRAYIQRVVLPAVARAQRQASSR
jgi:hypothetical protein